MSGLVEYKCPACGGAMEFDSALQKMKCPYCDTTMTVEEFEAMQKKDEDDTGNAQQSENAQWSSGGNNQWQDGHLYSTRPDIQPHLLSDFIIG